MTEEKSDKVRTVEFTEVEYLTKETTEFTQRVTIAAPKPLVALPVNLYVWNKIKSSVDEIQETQNAYHNGAWAFLGIAASSVVSLVVINPEEKRLWVFILVWVVFIASAILTGSFFWMSAREQARINQLRGKLKADMDAFENQFVLVESDE